MSERRASVTTSHNSSESTMHTDWKVGEGAVRPPGSQNIPGNDLFLSDKEKKSHRGFRVARVGHRSWGNHREHSFMGFTVTLTRMHRVLPF